ncbi:hypothetical protein [Heyndrickxia oleronia]|mgnify:CR=1 FL=1|uniref:spr1630 family ClpXP-sensitive toxin n=1 Tax=Heyndrickxia oleronia TaxID=38875 RepID=UPI001C0F005A|nr:hypothetical protein [Heyndrickxia oleronia]MBU5212479.1 hypothetical protein [Heyndrickxia oleronia]
MQKYSFDYNINQKIVEGILQGYKNYIQERNDKQRNMKISDAYAWVKGNHIDDQTARECEDAGILYKKAKAGYTWGYLQFSSVKDKSMFVIKNAKYFNEENFPKGKGIKGNKKQGNNEEDNYLKKLSRINKNIDFPEKPTLFSEMGCTELLTIFDENTLISLENTEVSVLQKEFEKFYIVTYEIDEAHMISSILVWMPNPKDNTAHLVSDLTELINNSSVDFSDVDITVLENDDMNYDYESPVAAEYNIVHENDIIRKKTEGIKS